MAKILLVAVNASYSHTALSVRGLTEYVKSQNIPGVEIDFKEVTINQPFGDILREISITESDAVFFSTYIWNAELTCKIIMDLKKVIPNVIIGGGGPEFGFTAKKYLETYKPLDFIMKGEGEVTLTEICQLVVDNEGCEDNSVFFNKLPSIKGIYYRRDEDIAYSGDRELLCDLSSLPFSYPFLRKKELLTTEQKDHKIYYYESSRGCPYSCSYCMSSLDKRVRFMPLERVFNDLQIFLDAQVGLVKFVDRTYNLNPERYIAIWEYILNHHNGKTMFHFEIEAEYISEEALQFLQKVPSGVMQFEIGVQSSNKKTLQAINRSTNIEKLAENIKRIPSTIHKHIDLISGLPYEDLESFGHSFDFVMALRPDALQLGFLKVLSGTAMELYASSNGWKWMENPVYETFSTPYMSYKDMMFLKDIEVMVDAYWNSGVFSYLMNYILRTRRNWDFFMFFTLWAEDKGVFSDARRETYWFNLFYEYLNDKNPKDKELLYDLLRYDFIIRGKQGNFPQWYKHNYDKDKHRALLEENGGVQNPRLDFAYSEYEEFNYKVDSELPENEKGMYPLLIKYKPKGKKN